MLVGDVAAQRLTKPDDDWDSRRSLAMVAWGLMWYGGPQQYLWTRLYPRLIGRGTTMQASLTAFTDALAGQLIWYVPCFYMVTGLLKGQTVRESEQILANEYLNTVFGQAGFWLPVQYINFRYVPPHLQFAVVSSMNTINKTWLSWMTNHQEGQAAKPPAKERKMSIQWLPLMSAAIFEEALRCLLMSV
jgi:hypothetical protein